MICLQSDIADGLAGGLMPRYYFDVADDGVLVTDKFGIELDDLYEAREQAIALLPDMARDELPKGERHEFSAFVRCPEGRIRYEARLLFLGRWIEPPILEAVPVTALEVDGCGTSASEPPALTNGLAADRADPDHATEAEPKPSRNAPRQSPIASIA